MAGKGWGSKAACGLFCWQFVVFDLVVRGLEHLGDDPRRLFGYVASVALAGVAWTAAGNRWARAAVAGVFGAALAVQLLAWRHFGTGLDVRFIRSAVRSWEDVWPALAPLLPRIGAAVAMACAIEAALLHGARSTPPARVPVALAAIAVPSMWLVPSLDRATAELRLAAGFRALFEPAPEAPTGAPSLGPLETAKSPLPSVLLIVGESLRAVDYCSAPAPTCEAAPDVNALLPGRVPLLEHRSTASYTALSVAAITTGRVALGARADIARLPTVFDFLRATRSSDRVETVMVSAHGKDGVWARGDVERSVDEFVAYADLPAETRDSDAGAVDAFEQIVRGRPGPLFAMLQLYDTHAPYHADRVPFQPATQVPSWDTIGPLHNQYKNAIYSQDRHVARAIRAFIASRRGPWVVLFTSDHGEAFGEHGAIHHGQSLYDEQIHVPAFVAWGAGAIAADQAEIVRERGRGPTSHVDLLPTVLDLYGLWDQPSLLRSRATMSGTSLLRRRDGPRAVPITSCTPDNSCPIRTWGMLGDRHALVAQSWDAEWSCVPLDGSGTAVQMTAECSTLAAASRRHFPLLPNGEPND
jgi:hypothetical protein